MLKGRNRILIVDDEPDILLMLRVNLEAEGYETLLASDGATALRRIEEERPDLVLLDIMMPIVDGWGVLDEVGGSDSGPRVIMLSAKAGEDDVLRAWRNGADEYVTKPFDPDRLMVLVEEVLERSADDRKARRESAIAQSAEVSGEGGEP
ncbi:MAG: hypothetical protein DCC49_03595 [Acidobacteria bacterium]|nr:MAG: hypothetical protein DCC49_03595 [Acidobacteriota bacterium]